MRRRAAGRLLMVLSLGLVLATGRLNAAGADDLVSLYAHQVTFILPSGLFAITPSAIKENYLGKVPPQHVYRNQTGDVAVAFNYMAKPVTQDNLEAFRDQLERDLRKKWPDLEWLGTTFITMQGVRWFQLEFKSKEQGYVVHNWVVGTPLQGRLLAVSLNAFDDFDPAMTAALMELKRSLTVRPTPTP